MKTDIKATSKDSETKKYELGEKQKKVTNSYRDNWNLIFANNNVQVETIEQKVIHEN